MTLAFVPLAAPSPAPSYVAPGPEDFRYPPVTGGTQLPNNITTGFESWITKSSLLLMLGGLIVIVLFIVSSRRAAVIPSKLQFAGEQAYNYVRNDLANDIIGPEFLTYVPLIASLFFFVLVNNLFGIVPIAQFAPFSRASFAYGLAIMVWVIYNGVGIKRHGFVGYWKHATVPSGVPKVILPLLIPLEFLSNILVRPITLSLRLFANMFAGHLLIILFSTGGAYLIVTASGIVNHVAGVVAFILGILVGFLEFVIEVLQAYVFALLTATYIAGALAEEH